MVKHNQNGYSGSSMSRRGVRAYESGEKPLSRWTKSDILEAYPEDVAERLKAFSLPTLKAYCLERSSMHHTSKFANKTDFYEVIEPEDLDIKNIQEVKPDPKAKEQEEKTRYHGFFLEKEYHPYSRWNRYKETKVSFKNATKKGDWLVLESGKKKRFDLCTIERVTKRRIK